MTPTPNTPPRSSSPGAATSLHPQPVAGLTGTSLPASASAATTPAVTLPAAGGFPVSDDMRPIDEIRALKSVAECHEWRKRNGNMDSMTYLALITRIDALRKLEAGE